MSKKRKRRMKRAREKNDKRMSLGLRLVGRLEFDDRIIKRFKGDDLRTFMKEIGIYAKKEGEDLRKLFKGL